MSDKAAEFEAGDLLRALGKVRVPQPRVLDGAREALWSAIAGEMLGTGAAGEPAAATGGSVGGEEELRKRRRRRQADLARDERRRSMGGGDG